MNNIARVNPKVVVQVNDAGQLVLSANVDFPQTKSMLSAMLNQLIQGECKKQMEQKSKIIKPTGFMIGEN